MKLSAKILLLFLFQLSNILAQTDSLISVESVLNRFISSATIEKENSELYDLIEYYLENKIDLNSASKSDLMKLPFANINDVNEVISYRIKNGNIFSYSELATNSNILDSFIQLLKLFTYINNYKTNIQQSYFSNYNFKLRSRVNYKLQNNEGFIDGYYKGSPLKVYNRIKLNANSKVLAGALIEKDAGDISYFDFYSFYLKVNNLFDGLNVLTGYYTMEFGQGLAMWSPYSFSKSSDATNSIIKRARSLSTYASAGEIAFLKGMAVEYNSKYFSLTSFYSIDNNKHIDFDKNTYGLSLKITPVKNINIAGFYYQHNELPYSFSTDISDKKINKYFSTAYDIIYKSLFITGEYSFFSSTIASINTMQISVHNNFLLVASIRNYPSNYKSYYARGFGETNTTNDEFGIYFGLKWKTNFGVLNFYLDQFSFTNSNKNITLPTNGNEISVSYSFNPIRNGNLFFRYFNEQKEEIELTENGNEIIIRTTNKLRTEFVANVNKRLRLKSRIEVLNLSKSETKINEKGLLLFQDFQLKLKNKLTFYGRIIFFQTDSFASRIYEFENDLIGVMKNQPLWGTGIKWYLLLRYNLFSNLNVSAKYSELYKPNETQLGSGYNSIEGNIENIFSLQIDFSF